ncbi:protein-export chaperone SecB [Asaia sp. VD9]|uniref:protein-export chaperone SecB n=1 Tax=Asaia sp. VD9 TaxID=3081235 RepID=UPI0030167A6A
MSEQDDQTIAAPAERTAPEAALVCGTQYLKTSGTVSFGAPEVFYTLPPRPHMALRLDVTARQIAEDQPNFEVSLAISATGYRQAPTPDNAEPDRLYQIDMVYAGLFALQNVRQDRVEALLLIEAPRLLFPSARHLLLSLIRESGFPVVNIQPVDFGALLQSRRAQS